MKISVIVPVYNAENTLEKCVESIINNRYKDVEIILVDDCSKDRSWHICQALAGIYANVICIHNEKNRGVSYTRNQGLKNANGKYTMFVDSDDWIEDNYLSEFVRVMETCQSQLAICGYLNHDEKMSGNVDTYAWKEFEGIKQVEVRDCIKILHDNCLLQQLWNKIFLTKLIKEHEIRFDETISIGEDLRFVLEYIERCNVENIILINKVLYHYIRGQAGSLMYRVGYESVEEPLKNMKSLYSIMGLEKEEIEKKIVEERDRITELYAYLIFHNVGMSIKEKRRLILALSSEKGMQLFKKNLILFCKEQIVFVLKKIKNREDYEIYSIKSETDD